MAHLRKRGSIYYVYYYDTAHKKVGVSTGTSDEREAEVFRKTVELKINGHKISRALNKLRKFSPVSDNLTATTVNDTTLIGWIRAQWPFLNPKERQAVVFTIYQGVCFYCGKQVCLPSRKRWERSDRAVLDHKTPLAVGGSDSFDNIVLACHKCNMEKLDTTAEEFMNDCKASKIGNKE